MSLIQQAQFLIILTDERTDYANREQLVLAIRWVTDDLEVHEEFIVLHQVDSIEAKVIYNNMVLLRIFF